MTIKKTTALRKLLLDTSKTTIAPFGTLPIHAQMAQRAGYEMFEISGSMTSFWEFGFADIGWMTQTEIVDHAARVAKSVDIPIYCDADTGYGSPANTYRTVQEFIRAGVAGIHIEDQREPKKAGNQAGISIVSDEEAVGRLQAASDARDALDPDFVLVARTDAVGAPGGTVDEAVRRGNLYLAETGADVIFYEGLRTWDDVAYAIARTDGPAYSIANMSAGPHPSFAELSKMGQTLNIFPFILPGVQEVWNLLLDVRDAESLEPYDNYLKKLFANRGTERHVGYGDAFVSPSYARIREWEEKYVPSDQQRDYVNTLSD